MSLDYVLDKIENWKEVTRCEIPEDYTADQIRSLMTSADVFHDDAGNHTHYQNPVTVTLIWATLTVGLPKITEKNFKEFWLRLRVSDILMGYPIQVLQEDGSTEGRHLTLEEVKQHIGLSTNGCTETHTKFFSRMIRKLESKTIN